MPQYLNFSAVFSAVLQESKKKNLWVPTSIQI